MSAGSGPRWVEDDAFYAELTRRNRGFVSPRAQERLRSCHVLVAGCGSTGGAAVEPLVRLGVQRFTLTDNGRFELSNLNRQHAFLGEVGHNKARVAARRVLAVNPHARVMVNEAGIRAETVDDTVRRADVVVDGVDVTDRSGWVAKYALHEAAARLGRPVITGWDMAGRQYVRLYAYDGRRPAFDGRITSRDVRESSPWTLMRRAIPLRLVPTEMLDDARAGVGRPDYAVSQVVYASLLFGAVAARMTADLLEGRPTRRHVVLDAHRAVRTRRAAVLDAVRKPLVALLAVRDLAAREPALAREPGTATVPPAWSPAPRSTVAATDPGRWLALPWPRRSDESGDRNGPAPVQVSADPGGAPTG